MHAENMTRRGFLGTTAALAAGAALGADGAAQARPNILLVTTDQQHWTAWGGADPFFATPAIDALAREGTVFDHAFCTTPQCSPSRSSLYTGLYPHKTSVITNMGCAIGPGKKQDELPAGLETIGSRLRGAGYRTGYFGKWHLHNEEHYAGHFDRAALDGDAHGGATEQAIAAMKTWAETPERPFCLCVNYINPHDLYEVTRLVKGGKAVPKGTVPHFPSWSETFTGKPAPQREYAQHDQAAFLWGQPDTAWEVYREFYREKVRLADEEIGRLLAHLKASGLDKNTVVVFTSDHGDMDTRHRLVFKGPFMYENLMRVPFIVRVPGRAAGRVDRFVTLCDVLPTLCALAGTDAGKTDGLSLAAGLAGERYPERDVVVGQYHAKQDWVNPIRMYRTREWKYNRYQGHGEELYDLRNDPDERVNLARDGSHARQKAELSAALDQWMKEQGDDTFAGYVTTGRDGRPL